MVGFYRFFRLVCKEDALGVSYRLGIPNREMQISLNRLFITYLTKQPKNETL